MSRRCFSTTWSVAVGRVAVAAILLPLVGLRFGVGTSEYACMLHLENHAFAILAEAGALAHATGVAFLEPLIGFGDLHALVVSTTHQRIGDGLFGCSTLLRTTLDERTDQRAPKVAGALVGLLLCIGGRRCVGDRL